MCGIVGYIGQKQAKNYILDGLETLEYRGYDSAGIAINHSGSVTLKKAAGRVSHLRSIIKNSDLKGGSGIGHTRWATHGGVTVENAHPHHDNNKEFYVVHNGIIENHKELRGILKKHGYECYSDTDTEVIPNLIAYNYSILKDVKKAFQATIKELRGAYAIAMTTSLDGSVLYAAKLSSPLALGIGSGEIIVGSDSLPIEKHTKKIIYLEDGEIAIIKSNGYKILSSESGLEVNKQVQTIESEEKAAQLGDFPDFMSKEINEAPETVRSALLGRLKFPENTIKLGGLESVSEQLRYIERIIIIACGTSYYAGMVGEYLIEEIAGIPVEVQQASEFRYRSEPLSRSTAVLVISQSGETADTIAALKKLDGSGILKLGVVNAPGSTLSRMTDAGVYCHAGPEKSVASTKAFIAQVTVLTLIALHLSKSYKEYDAVCKQLDSLPGKLQELLESSASIEKIAKKYSGRRDFLFIGRRYAFPTALEGALKLKELSYIHAEGFAGGEMKHGPLALIDEDFPTFAIALSNSIDGKSTSNMQEIKARSGPIIAVVDDRNSEAAKLADDVIVIPKVIEQLQPILSATVTHLFAYHSAKALGRDIDKPRNLAKSVTVE